MKIHAPHVVAATLAIVAGCSAPRTVERDRYFKPVIRHVQPLSTAPKVASAPAPVVSATPDPMLKILEGALAESRRELLEMRLELMSLRDSVRVIGTVARSQRDASVALADKVAVLEQQLMSQRTPTPTMPAPESNTLARREPPVASPKPSVGRVASMESEYQEGVGLFNRRRYDEARLWFKRLLSEGIQEDLADNCEYWLGESNFARGRWTEAVESFERVVALRGSNKRADALLMLGRTLEMLQQTSRARSTYERLIREFPSSSAAAVGRGKLRALPSGSPRNGSEGPVLS